MSANLSPADARTELNWLKYREQKERYHATSYGDASHDAEWEALYSLEETLQADLHASVYALAGIVVADQAAQRYAAGRLSNRGRDRLHLDPARLRRPE